MSQPYGTLHNRSSLRNAWRLALIGFPMSAAWLAIALLAPVSVPLIQALGLLSLAAVGAVVMRLGAERVETNARGVLVVPAFRRSASVSWPELASLESRRIATNNMHHGDIEDLAAALFDLDPHPSEQEDIHFVLVTRSGQSIGLPMASDEVADLIRAGWTAYTREFSKGLFAD